MLSSTCSELLLALGPVEQYVVPMAGIEVLDRVQRQAFRFDGGANLLDLRERPRLADSVGRTPAGASRGGRRDARPGAEVVDEVRHDVGGARLAREPQVVLGQHVPVQPEPEVHGPRMIPCARGARAQALRARRGCVP